MTMNASTVELRNLLGAAAEGVKTCSICGKPEARANKDVKALPHHAAAIAVNLPAQFRLLSKALGAGLMDFVTKERFNAQLESIRGKLADARAEHDAYAPAEKVSDKVALSRTLTLILAKLGIETVPTDASPLTLATTVHEELSKLMDIKAEVASE